MELREQFRVGGDPVMNFHRLDFMELGSVVFTLSVGASEERRYNCAKVSRKKIHRREMLGKSRNAVFFNDLWVGWVEK